MQVHGYVLHAIPACLTDVTSIPHNLQVNCTTHTNSHQHSLLQHLALTIHEELHVQERLLEDFEEEVDVSHNKMRAAQKRIKGVLQGSKGDWRAMLLAAGLIILLVFILLLVFRLVL